MSRYTPVSSTPASPTASPSRSRRSSVQSIRPSRPSQSSFRLAYRQQNRMPDPAEMDAAFDAPPDMEDDDENAGLLGRQQPLSERRTDRIPGDYDFERDYTLPPESPPPFQPYSSHNPAPGNTNGIIPSTPPTRPPTQSRHFLGGILPSSFLPRQPSPNSQGRVVGAGNSGIFANIAARPATGANTEGPNNDDYVPEHEQKDGPPSYQAALRDAVPPYWDTTVVLPSSSSPFGPLTSSLSGDEILIDGMPSGNFFGFLWNMVVSFSFQFVGFLLTYVLHTTHSAKYGSRVGLGLTMIQFGFSLRARAEELIETGRFPSDPSDPDPPSGANEDEIAAENTIAAFYGPQSLWPVTIKDPDHLDGPPRVLHNVHEAELFAMEHNTTLIEMMHLPSAADVGKANEWFSFFLMSIGWFLVLTSLGGLWRVKRFERGLRNAQRESEAAQAAANGGPETLDSTATATAATTTETTSDGQTITITSTDRPSSSGPGPTNLAYYTSAFNQAFEGARGIQRGFFGMNGRRTRGDGHAPLPQDDDVELFDADRFNRPMIDDSPSGGGRGRGLWG